VYAIQSRPDGPTSLNLQNTAHAVFMSTTPETRIFMVVPSTGLASDHI
jgi:hypothetical protein